MAAMNRIASFPRLRPHSILRWLWLAAGLCAGAACATARAAPALAFPGAQGWAAHTPGGRGGAILRVTTLDAQGPGSLRAAIEA